MSPHDLYDYDGVNESVLLDLPIDGQHAQGARAPRAQRLPVRHRPHDRRGAVGRAVRLHQLDARRRSKTGRLESRRRRRSRSSGKVVRDICPAAPGAKDWQPSAFSPRTGLLYIPHQNLCMDYRGRRGELHRRHAVRRREREDVRRARAGIAASSPRGTRWRARRSWKIKESFPVWSGALVTAGDVVFYGTMDGWFKAVDARTGELLWQFKAGSGIIGQPITYRGPDGKQYVAVLSGVGGWAGAIVAGELDPRDPTARARLRQRDEGSASTHDDRAACSTSSRCHDARAGAALAALASRASRGARGRGRELCASAPIPNNLPFSNRAAQGFENQIAELVARDLGAPRRVHLVGAAARVRPQHAQRARATW